MSENTSPSAKPDPEAATGEFDFAAPIQESPRVKRRTLKPQQHLSGKPAEAAASVPKLESSKATESPAPAPESKPYPSPNRPASATSSSTPSNSSANTTRPKTAASTPSTSPHGTRPATLYYSSGTRQDKETPSSPPMKSTPAAGSTPSQSSSTSATSSARTTSSSSTPATTIRPTSVSDYRSNLDRQTREQKSVGDILSILVYALVFLFVLGGFLAGYGIFALSKQIEKQSLTVADLDKHYAQENLELTAKLATTMDTLTQAQAQIAREQELIVQQQQTINKLMAATQDNESAIRTERATRADETSSIRARLRNLEYKGPTTQKY